MHEPTTDAGWDAVQITLDGALAFTHVVPCGDLRRHQLDPSCWCMPFVDDEDPKLFGHNAADGREAYEQGKPVS
jgi:hypothetical protein